MLRGCSEDAQRMLRGCSEDLPTSRRRRLWASHRITKSHTDSHRIAKMKCLAKEYAQRMLTLPSHVSSQKALGITKSHKESQRIAKNHTESQRNRKESQRNRDTVSERKPQRNRDVMSSCNTFKTFNTLTLSTLQPCGICQIESPPESSYPALPRNRS